MGWGVGGVQNQPPWRFLFYRALVINNHWHVTHMRQQPSLWVKYGHTLQEGKKEGHKKAKISDITHQEVAIELLMNAVNLRALHSLIYNKPNTLGGRLGDFERIDAASCQLYCWFDFPSCLTQFKCSHSLEGHFILIDAALPCSADISCHD